jgi:hypothetical protein
MLAYLDLTTVIRWEHYIVFVYQIAQLASETLSKSKGDIS